MAILLALFSAFAYGLSDFIGGLVSFTNQIRMAHRKFTTNCRNQVTQVCAVPDMC